MRLKGKVAVVTGAGSGFGVGIAKRFSEEGAQVLVVDIDEKNGSRVAQELKASFVRADVTKAADWARLVAEAVAKFGRLDIVVNISLSTSLSFSKNLVPACDDSMTVVGPEKNFLMILLLSVLFNLL